MGSHFSFGHLKHKLWPKERSGVKLPIWLLTRKSQESTWFTCLDRACDILLKSSQWGLQLCFRLHLNPRSFHKVMGLQSCGAPKLWESQLGRFRDSQSGVPGQKAIWMWAPWRGVEYTIRGKVVASPKSGLWWVLCVRVACGSS
jgi:hypothetical protein